MPAWRSCPGRPWWWRCPKNSSGPDSLRSFAAFLGGRDLARQLIAFVLVAAVGRPRFLALPAVGQDVDHVLALRGLAPVAALGLECLAGQRDEFALLRQGFTETGQEGLEITHADYVHAATRAGGEAGLILAAVFLER